MSESSGWRVTQPLDSSEGKSVTWGKVCAPSLVHLPRGEIGPWGGKKTVTLHNGPGLKVCVKVFPSGKSQGGWRREAQCERATEKVWPYIIFILSL